MKNDDLFVWAKPKAGSEFVAKSAKNKDGKEGMVIAKGDGYRYEQFKPLQGRVSLYRRFAELKYSGIIAFANEFGSLFDPAIDGWQGEFFDDWLVEIAWMKELVYLSELLRIGNIPELKKHIYWSNDEVAYVYSDSLRNFYLERFGIEKFKAKDSEFYRDTKESWSKEQIAPEISKTKGFKREMGEIDNGEVVYPAMYFLCDQINSRLDGTQMKIWWDPFEKKVQFGGVATSLLGALYYQFSLSVMTGRQTKLCQACGNYFEITGNKNTKTRSDRRYCTSKCKTNYNRLKEARALEMFQSGAKPNNIATALNTNIKTIKRWIEKKGK